MPRSSWMHRASSVVPAALVVALAVTSSPSHGGPLTREEFQRQQRVLKELQESIAAQATAEGKLTAIRALLKEETDVGLRRKMLETAVGIPGDAREAFLIDRLRGEDDAGLRSLMATTLGRSGSEKCLAPLAKAAASDAASDIQIGDIGGRSSARRASIFAIAELAERLPKLADKAAAELRALPDDALEDEDYANESLPDARRQALYQVTRDETLLKPFFDRLKSDDPKQRERGLVAFRFLKLKKAPAEVVRALDDSSRDVRLWAALVLGEIGDPNAVKPLMATAGDAKVERGLRANAIYALGRMRAKAAADLMEKLLADPALSAQAAIALYRITGKKVKEFPQGYNAD